MGVIVSSALQALANDIGSDHSGVYAMLAHLIQDQGARQRDELVDLHYELQNALDHAVAPGSVLKAIARDTPSDFKTAYNLGRLAFAVECVAAALQKRVDDRFYPTLDLFGHQDLFKTLLKGRKTIEYRTKKACDEGVRSYANLVDLKIIGLSKDSPKSISIWLTTPAREYLITRPAPQLGLPDSILSGWDELSASIDRILTAQPSQMTTAYEKLIAARQSFRTVVYAEANK